MKEGGEGGGSAAILPRLDPFVEELAQNSDRVFYFEEGPSDSPRLLAKSNPKIKNQATLETFS